MKVTIVCNAASPPFLNPKHSNKMAVNVITCAPITMFTVSESEAAAEGATTRTKTGSGGRGETGRER